MQGIQSSFGVMLRITTSLAFGAVVLVPQAASAQVADEGAAQAGAGVGGEIVVTARRVAERLERTPVSVTALSGEALMEKRLMSDRDLQQAVPGLTVRTLNSDLNINYTLRGQGVDAFSASPPAVSTYFNEVSVLGFRAVQYFDMESLQVLKGPQGTLFGRNSTGGAILYTAQGPRLGELSGYASAGYGNYDAVEVEGAVNIPLGDMAAFRLAGQYKQHDGYQKNLYDGSRPGSMTTRAVRGSLLVDSGTVRNQLTLQYSSWDGRGKALTPWYQDGGYGFASFAYPEGYLSPQTRTRELQAQYGFTGYDSYAAWAQNHLGFHEVMSQNPDRQIGREFLVTNALSVELSDHITLKNITGYQKSQTSAGGDNLGSPFMGQFLGLVSVKDGSPQFNHLMPYYQDLGFSNELQVQGNSLDNKLTFVAGLYYSYHNFTNSVPYNVFPDSYIFYPDGAGGVNWDLVAGLNGRGLFDTISKSYAAFAQASYEILPGLKLTAGYRHTKDKVALRRYAQCGQPAGAGLCDAYGSPISLGGYGMPDLDTSINKPSWTLGLDYQATESLMLYFNQRGSYRSGSFNGSAVSYNPERGNYTDPFRPETTYDFEVGAKFSGYVGGMRTRFNIAGYHQIIKDVQRAVFFDDGGGQTSLSGNVNKGKVTGVELDGSISLAHWLEVGGQGAYTHFRYTDPIATIGTQTFLFGAPADSPEWTGSAYIRLNSELPRDLGRLTYTADVYAQTGAYFTNLNNPDAPPSQLFPNSKLPGYTLLNMRLSWDNISGSDVSAALWVKNLTEEKYYGGVMPMYLLLGVNASTPGDPRTFGGTVTVRF